MNREIKFRYRYTDGKNWLFQVFTLEQIANGDPFDVLSDNPLYKDFRHVGQDQFTGLEDVSGNDIYEGDFLSLSEGHTSWIRHPFQVVFYEGAFCMRPIIYNMRPHEKPVAFITYGDQCVNNGLSQNFCEYIKVIGNIYENSDLLSL